jgi:hypothetical protein
MCKSIYKHSHGAETMTKADEQRLQELREKQSHYLKSYENGEISQGELDLMLEMYYREMLKIDPTIT